MARQSLDLRDHVPYLINRVGDALTASFEASPLARFQLSVAMWRVLLALSNQGDQRLVDLAAATSIDVSTLSRMVTRLRGLEMVTRTRSDMSEREVVLNLAPAGREALDQLIPIAHDFEKAAIAKVSAEDLKAFKRVLRQMYENQQSSIG